MSTPEEEAQEGRKKRTYLLLAGGAVSLLLPLGGVVYLRMNENKAANGPGQAASVFDRREAGDAKVAVTQTVTINQAVAVPAGAAGTSSLPTPGGPTAAPTGSSLDFVKGSGNYYQEAKEKAEAPKPSTPAAAAPAPEPEPAPAPAKTAKGGKKPFMMPKLSGTKSLTGANFKSNSGSPKPGGLAGMTGVADPQSGKSADDMMNDPAVQKLLQQQGK